MGLVIPALDEAATIGDVVAAVDRTLVDWVIVADNGSRDETAARAAAAGARVVCEPRRGYGRACRRALAEAPPWDIVVFLDGDGSDDPREIPRLLQALHEQDADLVIGSRVLGRAEPGALTLVQRLGNALTCSLVRLLWGARYTDLGPFRAVRRTAYERLAMSEPAYAWTIEMQVKAARLRLRVAEVPVSCRVRQGGRSKVSGTLLGSVRAGRRILAYVLAARLHELRGRRTAPGDHLLVFTRYPEPGRSMSRLIPALGPDGAAALQRRLGRHALSRARSFAARRPVVLEIHHAGGDRRDMGAWLGDDLVFRRQGDGDLGARMAAAFARAFAAGARAVVIVGTDCPQLDADRLAEAFAALAESELVLGPALDGGYYLIGLSRPAPELFRKVPWGTAEVCARTLDRASPLGLKIAMLGPLADVDRPEDLELARPFLDGDG